MNSRFSEDKSFTKLFEAAEIAKFTKEQYEACEESLKVYRDWQNTIATAKNKSHAEGLAASHRTGFGRNKRILNAS